MENKENTFVERFIEVCGTSEPARIQRFLDISYQAARNYLEGRRPNALVLQAIAERTPYSINWLLTGSGEKYISSGSLSVSRDTPLSTGQIRDLVRSECVEVINELLGSNETNSQKKIVVLRSASLKSEKVKQKPTVPDVER